MTRCLTEWWWEGVGFEWDLRSVSNRREQVLYAHKLGKVSEIARSGRQVLRTKLPKNANFVRFLQCQALCKMVIVCMYGSAHIEGDCEKKFGKSCFNPSERGPRKADTGPLLLPQMYGVRSWLALPE